MNNVFSRFPRADLAELPTPVRVLPALAGMLGHDRLLMKCDDLSGPLYGGNKIRKLEFLLGEALEQGRKQVITYGAAGSNHALATAVCCRQLGLKTTLILAQQELSEHVLKNLRAGEDAGAEFCFCSDFEEFPAVTDMVSRRCLERDGIEPYIIPAGGTNAVGALGFVQAAFELTQQVRPDVIYIPMGTGGTLAGLLTGFSMTDHKPRVVAVRVVEPAFRDEKDIKTLCDELCEKLNTGRKIAPEEIVIRDEFFGEGYGIPTHESRAAVETFQRLEQIQLENTYTGKTVAALLHDLRSGRLEGLTVLYWNTLNSRKLTGSTLPSGYGAGGLFE